MRVQTLSGLHEINQVDCHCMNTWGPTKTMRGTSGKYHLRGDYGNIWDSFRVFFCGAAAVCISVRTTWGEGVWEPSEQLLAKCVSPKDAISRYQVLASQAHGVTDRLPSTGSMTERGHRAGTNSRRVCWACTPHTLSYIHKTLFSKARVCISRVKPLQGPAKHVLHELHTMDVHISVIDYKNDADYVCACFEGLGCLRLDTTRKFRRIGTVEPRHENCYQAANSFFVASYQRKRKKRSTDKSERCTQLRVKQFCFTWHRPRLIDRVPKMLFVNDIMLNFGTFAKYVIHVLLGLPGLEPGIYCLGGRRLIH